LINRQEAAGIDARHDNLAICAEQECPDRWLFRNLLKYFQELRQRLIRRLGIAEKFAYSFLSFLNNAPLSGQRLADSSQFVLKL